MSLPVGTLVMVVRVNHVREMLGRVGTIIAPLASRRTHYRSGATAEVEAYRVEFPGTAHLQAGWALTGDVWHCTPAQIIPITPPGKTDDVTTDEPIEEVA